MRGVQGGTALRTSGGVPIAKAGRTQHGRFWSVADPLLAIAAAASAPLAYFFSRTGARTPISRSVFDRWGVSVLRHHFSEPIVMPGDLLGPLDRERDLPGLDVNEGGQLGLVAQFRYREELLAIPRSQFGDARFAYDNVAYPPGDAEMLYNMIRHFKPKRLIEVGSGQSTLLARLAIERNGAHDQSYTCEHICIEPYLQPWLEQLPVKVLRRRVECCADDIFGQLGANDILFIDSSHVIRPQGDVPHLYLHVLPRLASGVLVHSHDIFTPRDYLEGWVVQERRLYDEQYLLEAFLSFNREFEVLLAVNWLAHHHRDKLADACPILIEQRVGEPGAFWIRRVGGP
jgi:hypothetical protein